MYGYEIDKRISELGYSNGYVGENVGKYGSEIGKIRRDEQNLLRTDIFFKLMYLLNFDPLDFPGFVRLDLNKDLYDREKFVSEIWCLVNDRDNNYTIKDLAAYIGCSLSFLYKLFDGNKSNISIDDFYLLCEYFGFDYQELLVHKNIISSLDKNVRIK